jgi:hypothetical protein
MELIKPDTLPLIPDLFRSSIHDMSPIELPISRSSKLAQNPAPKLWSQQAYLLLGHLTRLDLHLVPLHLGPCGGGNIPSLLKRLLLPLNVRLPRLASLQGGENTLHC